MLPTLHLTAVHLRVSDLARSVDFYVEQLGFVATRREATSASLATSADAAPMLLLEEQSRAAQPPRDAAGLFHVAALFPSRAALGNWLQFAAAHRVDFEGFSDHGVSEAIYLSDPDGNGLEFYADRAPGVWPRAHGELAMTTRPLDVRNLLAGAEQEETTPLEGVTWGHLHLRVSDLDRSEKFYRTELGLELTQASQPGARFLSADGYHHHLGLNTWGNPHQAQPPDALGLVEATFTRADVTADASLVDPDGVRIRMQPTLVTA